MLYFKYKCETTTFEHGLLAEKCKRDLVGFTKQSQIWRKPLNGNAMFRGNHIYGTRIYVYNKHIFFSACAG